MGATHTGSHRYRECGLDNVYLENWPMMDVRGSMLPLLDVPALDALIAKELLGQPSQLNSDEALFLRKRLGYGAPELAEALGVERSDVSRWENGTQPIQQEHDFRLRTLALATFPDEERPGIREAVRTARATYAGRIEKRRIILEA